MELSEGEIEVLEIPGFTSLSKLREVSCDLSSVLNECWALIHKRNQKNPPFLPIFSKSFRLSKHDYFMQYVKDIQTVINKGHREKWIFILSLMVKSPRLRSLLVDREFHIHNLNLWTLLCILEEII